MVSTCYDKSVELSNEGTLNCSKCGEVLAEKAEEVFTLCEQGVLRVDEYGLLGAGSNHACFLSDR